MLANGLLHKSIVDVTNVMISLEPNQQIQMRVSTVVP